MQIFISITALFNSTLATGLVENHHDMFWSCWFSTEPIRPRLHLNYLGPKMVRIQTPFVFLYFYPEIIGTHLVSNWVERVIFENGFLVFHWLWRKLKINFSFKTLLLKRMLLLRILERAKSALKIMITGPVSWLNTRVQICFRERHRSILSLCGHVLCFSCATTISEHKDGKTCPTCRKSFKPEHIIKIFEATIL